MMDLEAMRQVDIRTVNPDELVDIKDVKLNLDLPKEERVQDYVRQIKNPYCFKSNGVVVKISFAKNSKRTLEDCMKTLMEISKE